MPLVVVFLRLVQSVMVLAEAAVHTMQQPTKQVAQVVQVFQQAVAVAQLQVVLLQTLQVAQVVAV